MNFYQDIIKVGGFYFAFEDDKREIIELQDCSKIGKSRTANVIRIDESEKKCKQYTNKDVSEIDYEKAIDDTACLITKASKKKTMFVISIIFFILSFGMLPSLLGEEVNNNKELIITSCYFIAFLIIGLILLINSFKINMPYLIYDITTKMEEKIQTFYDEVLKLDEIDELWLIERGEKHNDTRYHAGATSSILRNNINFYQYSSIKGLKTNVYTPSLGKILFFLPDIMFYKTGKEVIPLSYNDLKITISISSFRETQSIPSDSEQTGTTWKYVNKDGSRDKRFNDNKKIPIMKYCVVSIEDNKGVSINIMTSNYEAGKTFANALNRYKIS